MNKIGKIFTSILPNFLLKKIVTLSIKFEKFQNRKKSTKKVFTQIYEKNKWGKSKDNIYFSGPGSAQGKIITPYVKFIASFLSTYSRKPVIVDLGCGDFEIGKNFVPLSSKYIGVDIVETLIERNKKIYSSDDRVEFFCLDIISDDLPKGEICLVRQVLQHLSNEQILSVLKKLDQYRVTFITEHYPEDKKDIVPNIDKSHGKLIRAYVNSGVYLDKPPFNIPDDRLKLVLEVPGSELGGRLKPGIIRTFKYLGE
jgi:hypothetical protein